MHKWALGLCTSLLLIGAAFGQSAVMKNIPVAPGGQGTICGGGISGYTNTFTVTIGAQSGMSGSSVSNYPMYFIGNSIFKNTTQGGLSQSSGVDVVFCDGLGHILSYEFLPGTWSGTSGAGLWVVRVPSVSKTASTKIYGVVGKASATDHSCWTNEPSGTNSCGASGAVWDTSIWVRVYHLANITGAAFYYDSTGNAGQGTTSGTVTAIGNGSCGSLFGCIELIGGTSPYVDTGAAVPALTNYSLEAWMANDNSGSGTTIAVSNDNAANSADVDLRETTGATGCPGSGHCFGASYGTSGTSSLGVYPLVDVGTSGTFHHILSSHTAGSSNLTVYLDGATHSNFTSSAGSPVDPATSTCDLFIGKFGCNSSPLSFSTAFIGEIRLSKTALSSDVALLDYNNQNSPTSFYTVSTP